MGHDDLSFLRGPPPRPFERRVFVVAPGTARRYVEDDWRGAVVIVERGELELETRSGVRRRFHRGDVLWLEDLPLRALHNPGANATVLAAVSRRPG
jgi:hypothetical protein